METTDLGNGISQSKYEQALQKYETRISDAEVAQKVEKICREAVERNHTPETIKFLFSCMELTSLQVTDSEESILQLTEKVNAFEDQYPELPHLAAIGVYPRFAEIVSKSLEVEGVALTCVSGNFPSAQARIEIKIAETAMAVNDGATEIDIVMPVGCFLSGDYETLCDEIAEIKAACRDRKLKVILETGRLGSAENIKKAALLCMYAGADYIKTSTGKETPAATPEAAYVICQAIKEYYDETGIQIGFKAAGGISEVRQALVYYSVVQEVLGDEWLSNRWFRIGASRLANALLGEITGAATKFF